ncbi:MAG TPA: dCTP deaminase [Planctomycetes bacterium]|nr:dCTP deaminase [Planctomycetota bacterium]
MILTKNAILREIRARQIVIRPFDRSAVGSASIDLTLGDTIRVFDATQSVVELAADVDPKRYSKKTSIKGGYILRPGEFVLGMTVETITLPPTICGWLQSRSRFARIGFMSHVAAPFICPGVSNRQVLEIYNVSNHNILLKPGIKVCQLIFQRCEGAAVYRGKFKRQTL